MNTGQGGINNPHIGNQPFPPFPYFAFVDLRIQNFNFTPIPPEHLMSFDVKFTTDVDDNGIGEGSFTVFDETALRIEHALVSAAENAPGALIPCYFKFGYSETEHVSPLYSMGIEGYDLVIKSGGSELTVKIVSDGIEAHSQKFCCSYNTHDNQMTLVEIIEDIAERSGWEVEEIQDIEDILVDGDDNNGSWVKKYKEVRIDNLSTTHGMINKVLRLCRGEADHDTSIVLSFFDEGEGKVKVRVSSYGYEASINESVKEYSISWDGELGEVMSFSPKVDPAFMYAGAGTVDLDTHDEDTMDPIIIDHNAFKEPGKYLIGGREMHVTDTDAIMIPNVSAGIEEQLQRMANYLWTKSKIHIYTASMEILGDPYLRCFNLITVIVRTPSGIPHHTSGVYQIMEINHSISGGKWTTSLELLRDPSEAIQQIPGLQIGEHLNVSLDPEAEPEGHYVPVPEDSEDDGRFDPDWWDQWD